MADHGKRNERLVTYVDELLFIDINREAARRDLTLSDCAYKLLREHLYGIVHRNGTDPQGEPVAHSGTVEARR